MPPKKKATAKTKEEPLISTGGGRCYVDGNIVRVMSHKDDKGKHHVLVECNIDQFLGMGPMISAVYDYKVREKK